MSVFPSWSTAEFPKPAHGSPRELVAYDTGTASVQHESAKAFGERLRLRDPAMDLCRSDLGAALRIALHVSLGEDARDDEARDGHRENQRH